MQINVTVFSGGTDLWIGTVIFCCNLSNGNLSSIDDRTSFVTRNSGVYLFSLRLPKELIVQLSETLNRRLF